MTNKAGDFALDLVHSWMPGFAHCDWDEIERRVRKQQERARQQAIDARADLLAKAGVPKRSLQTLRDHPDMQREAMRYAKQIAGRQGSGIYVLAGGVGCGKTTAATWWLFWHGGRVPLFVTAGELAEASRADRDREQGWRQKQRRLGNCTALVIDDLGLEVADDRFLSRLDRVVCDLDARRRSVVLTTNMAANAFSERYKGRIVSRMRGSGFFEIAEGDMRKQSGVC